MRGSRRSPHRAEHHGVLPSPPGGRLVDDRHIERGHHTQEDAPKRAPCSRFSACPRTIRDAASSSQHQRRGQLRLPGPPGAPGGFGPDGAGNEDQRAEHEGHRWPRSPGSRSRDGHPGTQPSPAAGRSAGEGDHGRGHVEVEDALHRAHHPLLGCVPEDEVERPHHERRQQRQQERGDLTIEHELEREHGDEEVEHIEPRRDEEPGARGAKPSPASTRWVERTADRNTGVTAGRRRVARSASPRPRRAAMAAKSVPISTKATVWRTTSSSISPPTATRS